MSALQRAAASRSRVLASRRTVRDNVGVSLPPPAQSRLAPGFKLDRYELLCPIAEGGMASIWIARQTGKHGFRKLVAIKTILPKYAAEPKFQQMFVDEARIASRIEHVNVGQILDVGEQHDVTYLVMEYIDGDALAKVNRAALKKGKPIPLGVLLRIMGDTCAGLHVAHELKDEAGVPLGVIHRDVSPQNVLVTTKGISKLIDFGIAKARDRLGGDTKTEQVKGKVAYMAPEQALGRSMDRRADVWSVGAVLHHLIAGKPPFEGENEIQTLFALSSGKPPAPLPAGVPAPIAAVVRRSLSQSPDARYGTAAEQQEAIEKAMVEAGMVTTAAQVAAFMADLVGDRAEKRRESIALGLKAADERDKLAEAMRRNADTPESEKSGNGTGQTLSGSAAMAVPAVEPTPNAEARPARSGKTFAIIGGLALAAAAAAAALVANRGKSAPPPAPAATIAPSYAAPASSRANAGTTPSASASSVAAIGADGAPSSPSASATTATPPAWRPPGRRVPPGSAPKSPATNKQRDYGF